MASEPTSDLSPENFLAVDIQHFRQATRDISFDVFLKLADDKFAHVFSKTTGLDYKRLASYVHKGVRELYIKKEDHEAYKRFISTPAQKIFEDPEAPTEKKIATLLNMTEQNLSEIFIQMEVEEDTAANSRKVIKNYVELMASDPKTLAVLLKLAAHGEYLYYHSISVAVFSMFIARASGQFNKRTLEIVGLGGFLHDIGCTQLPKEVTDSPEELNAAEWKQMRSHPTIGLKMLEKTQNIPDEVRYIVYQHHEEPSGNGYPNGLRGPVIYYPAKIVALADTFSALISNRPYRPAYTVEQALQIIQSQRGKYDKDLVKILVSIFSRHSSTKKAA